MRAGAVRVGRPGDRRRRDQRHEDRHRPHQMRREPGREQAAFAQRLVHQPEFELLEVAQAAVDELARSARRAGGQIARLDERHRQPARGGVQRRTHAGDAATDDQNVEALAAQPVQVGRATRRRQGTGREARNRGISSHVVHGSAVPFDIVAPGRFTWHLGQDGPMTAATVSTAPAPPSGTCTT